MQHQVSISGLVRGHEHMPESVMPVKQSLLSSKSRRHAKCIRRSRLIQRPPSMSTCALRTVVTSGDRPDTGRTVLGLKKREQLCLRGFNPWKSIPVASWSDTTQALEKVSWLPPAEVVLVAHYSVLWPELALPALRRAPISFGLLG